MEALGSTQTALVKVRRALFFSVSVIGSASLALASSFVLLSFGEAFFTGSLERFGSPGEGHIASMNMLGPTV